MEEKENLRKKFVLHIFYNIIAFAIIFFAFAILVSLMVRNITYNSVDKELKESMSQIKNIDFDSMSFVYKTPRFFGSNLELFTSDNFDEYANYFILNSINDPKIVMVLRDKNGEIINDDNLGRFAEYAKGLNLYNKILDKVYDAKVAGNYSYRCINFKLTIDDDDIRYVQLLINVDSENELINNYVNILLSATIIGIILSIVASVVLSKYTLKPLEENLIKQTEFVQNASHELRTPLTIIQAKQELLLQEPNAKIIDKSEDIMLTLNETKRLTKLTKDLMMLSRADSQKLILQKEKVNLDEFIKNLVTPYIEIAEMQDKKLTLNLNYNNEINIDTNRIYQLIVILLDNAIKYTNTGECVEIATYMKENKCVIEVKDTGIGISDEGLKRVFERFYREDQARGRETGGSGLGLSIANLIVSAHGGTIKASHNLPKGSIFTIKLPK